MIIEFKAKNSGGVIAVETDGVIIRGPFVDREADMVCAQGQHGPCWDFEYELGRPADELIQEAKR